MRLFSFGGPVEVLVHCLSYFWPIWNSIFNIKKYILTLDHRRVLIAVFFIWLLRSCFFYLVTSRRVPVGTTVKKNYKKMPKIHKLNQTSSFLLWSHIISAPLLWKQRSEDSCLFSIFYIYFSKKCLFLVKKVKLTKISEIFVFNISSEPFKIFQKFQKAWIRWEHSFKMPYEGVQSDNK